MRSIYLGFLIGGLALGGCGGSGSQQTWYEECSAKGGKVYLSKGRAVCSNGSRIIDISTPEPGE